MTGPVRSVYRLQQLLWTGLDWIYPPFCGGCGSKGDRWCSACRGKARIVTPPICKRCGQQIQGGDECKSCRSSPPTFIELRSWAVFDGPVRNALHKLKYRRDIALGERLAEHLCELYEALRWPIGMVIPVPLGIARYKERGYNQAALIARPFSMASGLCYAPRALERTRETRSQVGLSITQRKQNVSGAFKAMDIIVNRKNVLLIDDVATSSATLDACATALLAAGATQVYCLTLARAM